MHLKRRIVSLFMASLLAVTISPVAKCYSDTEGTWAAEIIDRAAAYGLMEGYPDGHFGMGENMTRSAFVTVLCRLFGWTVDPNVSPGEITDISTHWAMRYVATAAAHGAIDPSGPFRPDDPISRLDMAKMLVRALGYDSLARSLEDAQLPFPDVIRDKGYVAIAFDFGIINGVEELGQLRFLPEFSASREHAAAMLVRCYERRHTKSPTWLHGFYAFSSYPQIYLADSMDRLSLGWAQFQFIDGEVLLNDTPKHNNDWSKPTDPAAWNYFTEKAIPCNLNVYAGAAAFNGALAAGKKSELIGKLTAAAADYAGLTIDFESLRTESRESFSAFMSELRAALPADKDLYVCVHPDLWYGGYDYRALGEVCDKVILMAHDYQWTSVPKEYLGSTNTYSPVTPLPQIYTALQHITDPQTGVRDRSKLALQFSFGTAGFQVDKNGLLRSTTIYHPATETVAKRLGQKDTVRTWDEYSHNPYIEYTTEDGKHYKLWYEDLQSVEDKLQLAKMFGVTGVSLWRLGKIPDYPGIPNFDLTTLFIQPEPEA